MKCIFCGVPSASAVSNFCTACGKPLLKLPEIKIEVEHMHRQSDIPLDEFESRLVTSFGTRLEHYFFISVVGVSHSNSDGSSRQTILKKCKRGEALRLQPEPSNPYDPNAVAVLRQDGEQIGYLDSRLAKETVNRLRDHQTWAAVFNKVTEPEEGKYLGAVIMMARLKNP